MNFESSEYKFSKDAAHLVKSDFHAKEVILFGSHAYGKPSSSSDIDLLVILDTLLRPAKQAALIRMQIDKRFGVKYSLDLMVRTPAQIEDRLRLGDFFIKRIMSEGIRL